MFKRLFNLTICLVMVLGSLSIVGGEQTVMADVAYLDDIAGISAYKQLTFGTDGFDNAKSLCPQIEEGPILEVSGTDFFICSVFIDGYDAVYAPHVFVHSSGWIMAYFLKDDPAAKMIDVIAQPLETLLTYPTLLENVVVAVGEAAGIDTSTNPIEVSYYDFSNPSATDMLFVAEDKAEDLGELGDDDAWFTIALPSGTYAEISYAFYQNYYPLFAKDGANFVIINADYIGPSPSGTIYGSLEADEFILGESYLFEVDTFSLGDAGYGALLITYSGVDPEIDPFVINSVDWMEEFVLVAPPLALTTLFTFDFAPVDFGKLSPIDDLTGVPSTVTLTWESSIGATSYEYCIDESDDYICDTGWVSMGTATSVTLTGLPYNATFYWQVKAVNSYETTEADGGTWWSFATITGAPAAFGKVSPADGAFDVATSPLLDWEDAEGAEFYEYCVDTEFNNCADNDEADWINTGLVSQTIVTLDDSTIFSWQVRASNSVGTTYADFNPEIGLDFYWSFTTVASFEKVSPEDETDEVSPKQSLEWGEMVGVTSYQYCVDTTDNDSCSRWVSAGTATTVTVKGLKYGTTYYWQVRGVTATGTTEADAGDWWMFITRLSKAPEKYPPAFSKVSPTNGATDQAVSNLELDWDDVTQATSYAYCIQDAAITEADPCTSWVKVNESEVIIPTLAYDTTYYWQVRATVAGIVGYADGGYWSFTTITEPEPTP